MSGSAQRIVNAFSERAELYDKYRWGYSRGILEWLLDHNGLGLDSVVVELGSGTGILTRNFVERVGKVIAIEPSFAMAKIARDKFRGSNAHVQLVGDASWLALRPNWFDLVAVGQAIHYFNAEQTLSEIRRILKPSGELAVLWIIVEDEALYADFKTLFTKENGCDVELSSHKPPRVPIEFYFDETSMEERSSSEVIYQDFNRFLFGLCTAADAPTPSHPDFPKFRAAAEMVFSKHASGSDRVRISLCTRVISGRINSARS